MATFTGHEACPECGSKDNLARYSDGSATCFGNCDHYEPPAKSAGGSSFQPKERKARMTGMVTNGRYADLGKRGLREETLRKYQYKVGETDDGTPCQIAPYFDKDGDLVAQKLRFPGKDFKFVGEPKCVQQLFGQQAWGQGGKRVVVTEGEIDAMSVAQVFGLKWPVVSVANGASDDKAVRKSTQWLESFEKVVFMFDPDDPGRKGAKTCAALLTPGKAFIANLPDGEDPNDLLVAGRGKEISTAVFEAGSYRPDGIRALRDVIDEACEPVSVGDPLPWPGITEAILGTRDGQLIGLGAGVGVGKTEVFCEIITYRASLGRRSAVFSFEQPNRETTQRIGGKLMGKAIHIPETKWTRSELTEALEPVADKVFLYDHYGAADWEEMHRLIRFLVQAHGVRDIYLDNLSSLTAHAEDERRFLDAMLEEMSSLAQALGVTFFFVSHLTTPKGTPHEEGGRVFESHFTGSRAIMRWAHFLWGLERHKQHEDLHSRQTTTFRILKDRYGPATGEVFYLKYDAATNSMVETDEAPLSNKKGTEDDPSEYSFT